MTVSPKYMHAWCQSGAEASNRVPLELGLQMVIRHQVVARNSFWMILVHALNY